MIIDSVITCGEYEKDLLWLKLYHESSCVDFFYLIENRYDYRGRDKGFWIENTLKDEKFKPYLGKIHVLKIDEKFSDPSQENSIDPQDFSIAERELRNASTPFILNKYKDDDWVLTSDIDEFFDFQDDYRREKILGELKDDPVQFERIRYWLDYDMRGYRSDMDIVNPAYKVRHLKEGIKLSDKKWVGRPVRNGTNPLVFEYCNCFSMEGILKKYNSSLHTFWDEKKIYEANQLGLWAQTAYQNIDKNNRFQWLARVKLHKNNSPLYIRENLDSLKTNLVPKNYIENRLKLYGFDGIFADNKDFEE